MVVFETSIHLAHKLLNDIQISYDSKQACTIFRTSQLKCTRRCACKLLWWIDRQTGRKQKKGDNPTYKRSNISVFRIIEMSFKNKLSSKQNLWTMSWFVTIDTCYLLVCEYQNHVWYLFQNIIAFYFILFYILNWDKKCLYE
jgi:hypothetical protein